MPNVESCPERVKSFFIRDILSKAAETGDVVQSTSYENDNGSSLKARSTTSLTAESQQSLTLDRRQFHDVSLYVPSPTHRHHYQQQQHQRLSVSLPAAIQQPTTTFLLSTTDGNDSYFHSVQWIHSRDKRRSENLDSTRPATDCVPAPSEAHTKLCSAVAGFWVSGTQEYSGILRKHSE